MEQSFHLLLALILALLSIIIGRSEGEIDLRQERIAAGVCEDENLGTAVVLEEEWDLCHKTYPITTTTTRKIPFYFPTASSIKDTTKIQCACDDQCDAYGDCCADAIRNIKTVSNAHQSCIELRSQGTVIKSVYGVSHCNYSWTVLRKSVEIAEKCELDSHQLKSVGKHYSYLQDIAVYSESSRVIYANIFCAICNFDSSQVIALNAEMKCNGTQLVTVTSDLISNTNYDPTLKYWQTKQNDEFVECKLWVPYAELLSTREYRDCKKVIKSCADNWTDKTVAHKCYSYASYIYETDANQRSVRGYKNFHCALCNNVSTMLSCVENYPSCAPSCNPPGKGYHSLSLLLDFNFAGDSGEWVGVNYKCEKFGQLYDPRKEKCVSVYCEPPNVKDSITGECVAEDSVDHKNYFENTPQLNCTTTEVLTEGIGFVILDNNSLVLNATNAILNETEYELSKELTDSGKRLAKVCAHQQIVHLSTDYVQLVLTEISLIISIVCLTLHIIVYTLLPTLLNLPAKNLLSLAVSILVAHLFFIIKSYVTAQRNVQCVLIAVITHYAYLASFSWMSVMAFDVCRTFRRTTRRSTASKRNTFLKYSLYAWLMPASVVIVSATFDIGLQENSWSPSYGSSVCWISHRRALLIFFALPIAAVMALNMTLFVLTALGLRKTAEQTKMVRKTSDIVRYFLYIKLAVVMGLTWIFGFVASLTKIDSLWYPFIVLNGLQGAIIFFAFTCKRKIWHQLLVRFGFKAGYVRPSRSATSSDIIRSGTASTALQQSTSLIGPHTNTTQIDVSKQELIHK